MARAAAQGLTSRLVRAGVTNARRAESIAVELIERGILPEVDASGGAGWLAALGASADPDAALLALARLADAVADSGSRELADVLAPGCRNGSSAGLGVGNGPPSDSSDAPSADTDSGAILDAGAQRLFAVLGGSSALADLLVRHPELLSDFAGPSSAAPGWSALDSRVFGASTLDLPEAVVRQALLDAAAGEDPVNAMRFAYRRRLTQIAAADLTHPEPTAIVDRVAGALADLAGAALDAGLAIARAEHPEDAAAVRLAVIGMGKCGGGELNYVSDVDVIYVAEPVGDAPEGEAMAAAARLATAMTAACSAPPPPGSDHPEPLLWPVDAALRPEGKSGPLVRTVESHRDYLERWAQTWEFQALLKARAVAGDRELAQRYLDMVTPYVWRASERDRFVEDAQAMRLRVISHVRPEEAELQLKLGRGGLRDVEFTVQLLQLVHGRADETLRIASTLPALAALAAGGYVSRADAEELDACYRQMRVWEHRLQLTHLRRTHLMPSEPAALRRLGRAAAMASSDPDEVARAWRRTRRKVRELHEELFYRPLLPETAKLTADEAVLAAGPARDRLGALGYRDPDGAMRHIRALTDGVKRRAAIQRQLLPVMLGWFADGADPDAALLAFRDLSEKLGDTPWFLRMLRDSGTAAPRLAHVLASSRFLADALGKFPEATGWLGDEERLRPPGPERLAAQARAIVARSDDPAAAAGALRAMRHREMARAGIALVLGLLSFPAARKSLSEATDAAILGLLGSLRKEAVAGAALPDAAGDGGAGGGTEADGAGGAGVGQGVEACGGLACELGVVAFGSLGAQDLGFGSDCDVAFVYRPLVVDGVSASEVNADKQANEWAGRMVTLLRAVGPHPPIELDTDLRPEGRRGPLARSLDSFEDYYRRWAALWERQALVRVRVLVEEAASEAGAGVAGSSGEAGAAGEAGARGVAGSSREAGVAGGPGSPSHDTGEMAPGEPSLAAAFVSVIDPQRYRERQLDGSEVKELRRMKARIESERLPRGADPARHVKLGPGGMSDVEWLCQLLQLEYAGLEPALRVRETLEVLAALVSTGYLTDLEGQALAGSWRLAAAIRDANVLWRGRADAKTNELPHDHRDLAGIAGLLGYGPGGERDPAAGEGVAVAAGPGAALEDDYLRLSRQARAVFNRRFYSS